MAQHAIAPPSYPASGNTSWKGPLETILEAFRAAINDTDSPTDPRPAKVNDRGAWAATTAYAIGDMVTRNARRYLAPTAFTSGSTFTAANWIDLGPLTITVNGASPNSTGDITVAAGGSTGTPTQGSRFLAGVAYGPLDYGSPSNITPSLSRLILKRAVSARVLAAGATMVASWFQNAGVASSFFRPALYKLDPATLALTLLADFGQVDTSSGAGVVKATSAVATLADVAVGDYLAWGGVGQGAAPTVQGTAGFDPWLPSTVGPASGARPQALYLDGVTGACPASIPALGASGGVSVLQSGSAAAPLVYLAAQA